MSKTYLLPVLLTKGDNMNDQVTVSECVYIFLVNTVDHIFFTKRSCYLGMFVDGAAAVYIDY